jgi:MULE transposase domain
VFAELKSLNSDLAPKTVVVDYEKSLHNGLSSEFPTAELQGCFFHFLQANIRQLKRHPDIYNMYSKDNDSALMIKHLFTLAFLPPQDVVNSFEMLMQEQFFIENEEVLVDFVTYFERTWIGVLNRSRTRRLAALYPIEKWNCYQSILQSHPKTNNSCEGFHSGFSSLLGAAHPTIYKFINGLKEQQTLVDLKINQFLSGVTQQQKKKYKTSAEQLKLVVQQYAADGYSVVDHVRKLALFISK